MSDQAKNEGQSATNDPKNTNDLKTDVSADAGAATSEQSQQKPAINPRAPLLSHYRGMPRQWGKNLPQKEENETENKDEK